MFFFLKVKKMKLGKTRSDNVNKQQAWIGNSK